ncbi:MAG: hypothetical protein ABEI13_03810, partial [Candidatus Paceibacteria bacterium]
MAAALAEKSCLSQYVTNYTNKNRLWERVIETIPVLSGVFKKTFGRRKTIDKIPKKLVVNAGILADILCACAYRIPGHWSQKVANNLGWKVAKQISKRSKNYAHNKDVIIASYYSAKEIFEHNSSIKILNHPSIHYKRVCEIIKKEKKLEPEFACTLPNPSARPAWLEHRLDQERELADKIFVGSHFARSTFVDQESNSKKITAIPYGSDVSKFTSPSSDTKEKSNAFKVLF